MPNVERSTGDVFPQPEPCVTDSVTFAICPLCDEPLGSRPRREINFAAVADNSSIDAHATCVFEYLKMRRAMGNAE
jgi:hypothetical protein